MKEKDKDWGKGPSGGGREIGEKSHWNIEQMEEKRRILGCWF